MDDGCDICNVWGWVIVGVIEWEVVWFVLVGGVVVLIVDQICVVVGISQWLFFNYFDIKEDVLFGWDFFCFDEQCVVVYLVDFDVGVLIGVMNLVVMLWEFFDDL